MSQEDPSVRKITDSARLLPFQRDSDTTSYMLFSQIALTILGSI